MELQSSSTNRGSDGASLARGLGWFSVGLGIAEVAAPRALARLIGIDDSGRTPSTLRSMGARELLSGIGILTRPRRPGPVWSRVAGDAIDIGLLAWSLKAKRTNTQRLVAALVSVLGVTALDVIASQRLAKHSADVTPIAGVITINRPPQEVYAYWRNFAQLPTFMEYLDSVTDLGEGRSHWVAKLPVGGKLDWDAEIVVDRPGEYIAWRSVAGAEINGSVSFIGAPGGHGTEVCVEMEFAPGGKFGGTLAKLFAHSEVKGDLRRFKQMLELGEVVRSDASIHRGPHPARPPKQLPKEIQAQKEVV